MSTPAQLPVVTDNNDILSWTNQDTRESMLFNAWGVLYRFQTTSTNHGSVTTLWRTVRPNREDRVAKLEWAPNGNLGRVTLGKVTYRMADLTRADPNVYGGRAFVGPDGLNYLWKPSSTGTETLLYELGTNEIVAYFRPTRPTRYQIGDVFGELHYIRSAGVGTVMHPPIMDMVTVTAMLYRFCAAYNL